MDKSTHIHQNDKRRIKVIDCSDIFVQMKISHKSNGSHEKNSCSTWEHIHNKGGPNDNPQADNSVDISWGGADSSHNIAMKDDLGNCREDVSSGDSEDSTFIENDNFTLNSSLTLHNSISGFNCTPCNFVLQCATSPRKVYPDLLNDIAFDIFKKEELENCECENFQEVDEDTAEDCEVEEKEEEEDDVHPMPSSLPHRMHYLDNVVYMSPKRNSLRDRANSLPNSAPLVNLNDLARLQGMYEKSKKGIKGNRISIGKSVFNRLAKRLSSVSDTNDVEQDLTDARSSEATVEEKVPSTSKKNKFFDRRGSALIRASDGKSKSARMGQMFRWTFTSGNDHLLQQAVANKDTEMLEKLLVHNRYLDEINYLEPPGVTVFHQACAHGDFRVVKLLIENGADVGLLTWKKLSPLKIAVMSGHYEIAELLLKSGANLDDIRNGFQDYASS